jgi:hypothetical protein
MTAPEDRQPSAIGRELSVTIQKFRVGAPHVTKVHAIANSISVTFRARRRSGNCAYDYPRARHVAALSRSTAAA